jgi:cold shock protein
MLSGFVKFYRRGQFGFICRDDGGADVFCHCSALKMSGLDTLEAGTRVRFSTVPDRRDGRPRAINIVVIS